MQIIGTPQNNLQNFKYRTKNFRNIYTTYMQLKEFPRKEVKLECICNSDALIKIYKAEWGAKKRTISVVNGRNG